jgi:hypothetical protein
MAHDIQLHGARLIQKTWDDSSHLGEIIDTIEAGLREESDKSIDGAKCLIEAIGKTILTERGVELDGGESPASLMKKVFKALKIGDDNGGGQLRDMLSGLTTATNGLERIRDAFGPLAHGRDARHQGLGDWHRLMAVRTAETIAVLLFEAHSATIVDLRYSRLPFQDDDPENQVVDEEAVIFYDEETREVVINEFLRFRPSQILYTLDREAYVEERVRSVDDARLKAEQNDD